MLTKLKSYCNKTKNTMLGLASSNKSNSDRYYHDFSELDESIRSIRTNLMFSTHDGRAKTVLITSSEPNEGKSTIAVNLARNIASNGKRVLLIDCDLRNPSIAKIAGIPKKNTRKGLTSVLIKNLNYKELVKKDLLEDNLDILLTGIKPPNPAELLDSPEMHLLLSQVRDSYDLILIDSPPVGIITDAAIVSNMSDGVLMIVSEGNTHKSSIKTAVNNLELVEANILGFIMNKSTTGRKSSKYYNDYH